MAAYNVTVSEKTETFTLFKVSFGDPAQNDEIVKAASAALSELGDVGGPLALVNGPASLPCACVLAHHLAHRFGAVAVYDPKLGSYVVSITHNPSYPLGLVLDKESLLEG